MEYTALESQQYYSECKALIEGLGYALVELHIVRVHSGIQTRAVIAPLHTGTAEKKAQNRSSIGVNDCAKVHRLLLPRLEALLRSQEVYMEVTSPGMNRNIKNAAEFALFIGKEVRLWDKNVSDWVSGIIEKSDTASITFKHPKTGETQTLQYTDIAKAKLVDTEG